MKMNLKNKLLKQLQFTILTTQRVTQGKYQSANHAVKWLIYQRRKDGFETLKK